MSVEQEPDVQQVVVSNRREYEQLPQITQRDFADRAFVFLYSCYTTALAVQLLSFVPIVAPVVSRIPWLVLGVLLLVSGIRMSLKLPLTKLVLIGILLGTIVGI